MDDYQTNVKVLCIPTHTETHEDLFKEATVTELYTSTHSHRSSISYAELDEGAQHLASWFRSYFQREEVYSHLIVDPLSKSFDPDDCVGYVDHSRILPIPDPRQDDTWAKNVENENALVPGPHQTSTCTWDDKAWEKRTLICYRGYHVLTTLHKGGNLRPNGATGGNLSGEQYVLKYSDAPDKSGRYHYVDIDIGTTPEERDQFYGRVAAAMREVDQLSGMDEMKPHEP